MIFTICALEVAVVEECVYMAPLFTLQLKNLSSPDISGGDISGCNAITHVAMQNPDNQIWKSRISISTKLKLYNLLLT